MTSITTGRAASLATLFALSILWACSDESTAPPASPAPVSTVTVTPALKTIAVGGQLTLAAVLRDADANIVQRPVTWKSENEAVATVQLNGNVTALTPGSATISATSEGKRGIAVVTVVATPVAEVVLSAEDQIELEWNGVTHLSARAVDFDGNEIAGLPVAWFSSRPSVASITPDGTIEAHGPGNAMISATIGGVSSMVGVHVKQVPLATITLDADPSGLEAGDVIFFGAKLTGVNGESVSYPVVWTTSSQQVAMVSSEPLGLGRIATQAAGKVTITASAEGKSASIEFSVAPRPTHDVVYTRWSGANGGAGIAELFVLRLDGSAAEPIRINAGDAARDPSPSPDGSRIVFAVSQLDPLTGDRQDDLYIVSRDGLNVRQLTNTPGIEDQPAWSPDGSRIVFHATNKAGTRNDLWVVNADGTGLRNVTQGISAEMTDKREPSWSPDGTRIAFIGAVKGQHKVWIIPVGGGSAVQFTTDEGFDATPSWSPDGRSIAFARFNTRNQQFGDDIMVAPLATGIAVRNELDGDQRSPVWSPDGHYIAFTGTARAGHDPQNIYTMRVDGTGIRLRTRQAEWGGGNAPAWIKR